MLRMKLLKDCCTKGFYKMSKYRVDFHIHTKFSDGQASPAEIVDAAKALGYHQIAITDHDGIDGLPEALEEANTRHGAGNGDGFGNRTPYFRLWDGSCR